MLNENQINELKDKIGEINVTKETKELFNKIDRNAYETGLLFRFCYDKLRMVEYEPLKEIVNKCSEVGENRLFEWVTKYPNLAIKAGADMCIQYAVNKDREFIDWVISLVFNNLISTGGFLSSLERLKS